MKEYTEEYVREKLVKLKDIEKYTIKLNYYECERTITIKELIQLLEIK